MIKVSLIPASHVGEVWDEAEPYISQVCDLTYGRANPIDILDRCLRGVGHLWVAYEEDGKKIIGAAITRETSYPDIKLLTVEQLAGERFDEWINLIHQSFEDWAKHLGCAGMELIGRPGWKKRLAPYGWQPKFEVCQLLFKDKPSIH